MHVGKSLEPAKRLNSRPEAVAEWGDSRVAKVKVTMKRKSRKIELGTTVLLI